METFAPAANFSFSHSLFLGGNLMWWKAMVVCFFVLQLGREASGYFFCVGRRATSHRQGLLWFSSLTRSLAECEILRKTAPASSKWVGKIWFPRQMDFCEHTHNLRMTLGLCYAEHCIKKWKMWHTRASGNCCWLLSWDNSWYTLLFPRLI